MMRKWLFLIYALGLLLPDQCFICRLFYHSHLCGVFTLAWRTEGAVRQPMVCVCVIPQTDVTSKNKVTTDLKQRKEEETLVPKVVTTGEKTSASQYIKCNKHWWILTLPVQANAGVGGCNLVMKINWEQERWDKGALSFGLSPSFWDHLSCSTFVTQCELALDFHAGNWLESYTSTGWAERQSSWTLGL